MTTHEMTKLKLNLQEDQHKEDHHKQKQSDNIIQDHSVISPTPVSLLIHTPQNPSYSTILESRIHNLRFLNPTTPKPSLILTPFDPSHVQEAVKWAKNQPLRMKIRSGGHDYEGLSYKSSIPFFILDMFNLRAIDINLEEETAWVQVGATIGELVYSIAKQSNTHGFPAGVCPSVGIGGHFSGGGYGNMIRKFGLTIDNVIDAQIVDSNGMLLNRETMGEDLFWAIRGGGGSSFGAIVSYKIKLVRVPEIVTVFRVSRTMEEDALEVVLQWQEIASVIDDNLFIRLITDVVDRVGTTGEKTVRATFNALFLGDSETLISLLTQKFPKLGLQKSDCQEVSWVQSVLFWADFSINAPIESLFQGKATKLSYHTRKSDYVKEPISKQGFEFIWNKMIELKSIYLIFNPYGGRMNEISEDEVAFPHRKGNLYKVQYLTNWYEEGKDREKYYLDLTRKLYDYMTPFVSKSPRQAYYNYKDLDLGINLNIDSDSESSYLSGRKYGIPYFMGNFDKLVKVKTLVDPTNLFNNEQSIPTLPM